MKIENNKLIAEFMGIERCTNKACENDPCYYIDGYRKAHDLEYDLTWDWLMPVVEKIEAMDICDRFDINKNEVYVWAENITVFRLNFTYGDVRIISYKSKIEAVYNAVIEFINWYNTQKVNQPSL